MLNWGLMGTARINRSLIPPLRVSSRNNLLAVASRSLERATDYAATWHIDRAYGSYEDLLGDSDIDVVYIPLPNHVHAKWAIEAAKAGKHVLCEKPIALNVEDVDRIEAAARDFSVVIAEAFMYRHHARTLQVKQLIEDGAIGDLHLIKGSFSFALNRPDDIRWDPALGGGSLWDVGCYPVSFARFVMGAEPTDVFAWHIPDASGIDLSLAGQLRFPGNRLMQFDSSFRSHFRMHMEFVGNQGVMDVPLAYKPGQTSELHITTGSEQRRVTVNGSLLYLDEIEDMARAVLDGTTPRISLSESRGNIAVIEALYRSAHEGNPVSLAHSAA